MNTMNTYAYENKKMGRNIFLLGKNQSIFFLFLSKNKNIFSKTKSTLSLSLSLSLKQFLLTQFYF